MLARGRTTVVSRRRRRPILTTTTSSQWDDLNPRNSVTATNVSIWNHFCQTSQIYQYHHSMTQSKYHPECRGHNHRYYTKWRHGDTILEPHNDIYKTKQIRYATTNTHTINSRGILYADHELSNRCRKSQIRRWNLSTTSTTNSNTPFGDPSLRTPTAEEWKENIERLLDDNMYPIGFSNMPQSISLSTSWCQQVTRVLHQTTVFVVPSDPNTPTVEPALRLLDRLFLEQEAYNHAISIENDEITSIGENGGVLMSPDISSSAIATALATWKLSLEHPNSKHYETSLAWERVTRYGNFLANHDGSMLSQISKVIGPVRRTTRSPPPTMEVIQIDPNEVDTSDVDTTVEVVENNSTETILEVANLGLEVPTSETQQQESLQPKSADFDDDHLLGIPLHAFNADSDSNDNADDLIKKRKIAMDNSNNVDGRGVVETVSLEDDLTYDRAVLAANEWDTAIARLLDINNFPIGFSNTADLEVVDVWFSEMEQVLWQTNPSTVQQALELIDRWQNEQNANNINTEPKRTYPIASFALNHVLHCWLVTLGATDSIRDALTPEYVWNKISSLLISPTEGHDDTALSLIVKAIGMIEVPEKAPIRAESLLQTFLNSRGMDRQVGVHLSNNLVHNLLKLWQHSQLPDAASEADRLLSMLKEWHGTYQRADQIPDDGIYATIISMWVASASPGKAIYRAEVLINEMQREPSFVVLGTFIDALAKVGHVERAHTLLNKYIQKQTDSLEQRPRSVTSIEAHNGCNPILSIFEAYRNRLDRQPLVAIVQMERFVSQLEKLASDFEVMRNTFHPNVACYNVLIGGYSHLRTPHKAEGLLRHVMRLLTESTDKVIAADRNNNQPVITLFNNVLDALAQSGEAEAVPRAVALVRNMEAKCREDPFYQPNVETYSLLLYCLAYDRRNVIVDNARETELLLERMKNDKTGYIPKPNADCYDIVLRAWCRAGYPDHAETMLQHICEDVGAFKDTTDDLPADKTFPTAVQFLIVMQGWVSVARRRNGHHQALSKVEQLLQKMHILHIKGFQTKPTIAAHNMFLECLAKSEESYAPERAESFLLLMDQHGREDPSLVPDVVIYNSVLNTWFRSNRYDAPIKATALFKNMKSMKDDSVRVINATSYIIMMGIYTQHAMPNKVQEVFDELMQTEDSKLRVPLSAYTTLLHAWSLAGKSKNVETILKQLIHDYDEGLLIGPGKDATIAFNAMLKCFLDSKKEDAADMARECLDFMNTLAVSGKFDVRPNHASYCYAIKSLFYANNHDVGRRAVHIFNEMKNLFMENGDAQIRPDLKIYTDLVSVLVKSNLPTYSVSEATAKIDANTDLTTFDLLHTILEEMDGVVNPTCWVTQGEASLSRMAWHLTETNILSISEKVSLMFKLRRLADQHSVKLDHTILLVLKNFRQMESSNSMKTSSSATSDLGASPTTTATNM